MESNEKEMIVMQKAEFYFQEKLEAHILLIPKPKFMNGLFSSQLVENEHGKFYWFLERGKSEPRKLFLFEMFDVEDYREERE